LSRSSLLGFYLVMSVVIASGARGYKPGVALSRERLAVGRESLTSAASLYPVGLAENVSKS
jgi:hypothetical protein